MEKFHAKKGASENSSTEGRRGRSRLIGRIAEIALTFPGRPNPRYQNLQPLKSHECMWMLGTLIQTNLFEVIVFEGMEEKSKLIEWIRVRQRYAFSKLLEDTLEGFHDLPKVNSRAMWSLAEIMERGCAGSEKDRGLIETWEQTGYLAWKPAPGRFHSFQCVSTCSTTSLPLVSTSVHKYPQNRTVVLELVGSGDTRGVFR